MVIGDDNSFNNWLKMAVESVKQREDGFLGWTDIRKSKGIINRDICIYWKGETIKESRSERLTKATITRESCVIFVPACFQTKYLVSESKERHAVFVGWY